MITVQGPTGEVTDTIEGIITWEIPELGGSYFLFSTENNYMIWTFLKKCWQRGWLYRGVDVMPCVPALCNRNQPARNCTRWLPGTNASIDHCAFPTAWAQRVAARLDDHSLDAIHGGCSGPGPILRQSTRG